MRKEAAFPEGHFYSPVVDVADVVARRAAIWPQKPAALGIDFNEASHRHVLTALFPKYGGGYDYPDDPPAGARPHDYYTGNDQFGWLDSRTLYVLMRAWEPRRIVEVGSGYSSLLMADVNQRYLDGRVDIACIEPFPRDFLKAGVPGIRRLIERKVQDVPLSEFEALGAGDVLFIDSSHVAKTGSDVNFLYFEVLPRLNAGVRVHIHDIFLPNDYPADWVLNENRSWNEQYVLRALLMYSQAFRIVFGCSYAFATFPGLVEAALGRQPGEAFGGGSLWLEKTAEAPT